MTTFVPTLRFNPYPALSPFLPQVSAKGKSVLVTGGGSGIGRAIPDAFAKAGAARIAITGRTEEKLEKTITELKETYPRTQFHYFVADITDAPAVHAMFDSFGAPDILINNAGFLVTPTNFKIVDLKEWWAGFEINVLGTATVTQAFLRSKPETKPAVVITIGNAGAHMGTKISNFSPYVSSKAAVMRLSEAWQAENPEVRFVSVNPGAVDTEMYDKTGFPKKGMTDPALSAEFILWAASEEAGFMRGRFAWVNWDVEELKGRREEILREELLQVTFRGF